MQLPMMPIGYGAPSPNESIKHMFELTHEVLVARFEDSEIEAIESKICEHIGRRAVSDLLQTDTEFRWGPTGPSDNEDCENMEMIITVISEFVGRGPYDEQAMLSTMTNVRNDIYLAYGKFALEKKEEEPECRCGFCQHAPLRIKRYISTKDKVPAVVRSKLDINKITKQCKEEFNEKQESRSAWDKENDVNTILFLENILDGIIEHIVDEEIMDIMSQ